jgi:Na+/H+ antiporter NhaC
MLKERFYHIIKLEKRQKRMSKEIVSIIIPVIVILLAIWTKRIIPSLIAGIILGGIMLAEGNIISGFLEIC